MASPQELGYSAARSRDLQARLHTRLSAVSGVRSLALASRVPLDGNVSTIPVALKEGDLSAVRGPAPSFPSTFVSVDHIQAWGIPPAPARRSPAKNAPTATAVAVISEALAKRFWPGDDALGKTIWIGSSAAQGDRHAPAARPVEVIGVVPD